MPPDWKPRKRIVGSQGWWGEMQAVKTGMCQACGKKHGKTSWHHLVGRDLGGDDVPENLAELQGDGVAGCHGEIQRLERRTCSALRARLRPSQVGYIIGRKSEVFLNRYYPKEPHERSHDRR